VHAAYIFSLSIKVVATGDYVTPPILSHLLISMLAALRLTLPISRTHHNKTCQPGSTKTCQLPVEFADPLMASPMIVLPLQFAILLLILYFLLSFFIYFQSRSIKICTGTGFLCQE